MTISCCRIAGFVGIVLSIVVAACGDGDSATDSDRASRAPLNLSGDSNLLANGGFEAASESIELCGGARILSNQTGAPEGASYLQFDDSTICEQEMYPNPPLLLISGTESRARWSISLTEIPSNLVLSMWVRLPATYSPLLGFRLVSTDGVITEDWIGTYFDMRGLLGQISPGAWTRIELSISRLEMERELFGQVPRWFDIVLASTGTRPIHVEFDDVRLIDPSNSGSAVKL